MRQLANLSNTDASDIRIYYDTATNAVTRAILKSSDENYFVFDGKKLILLIHFQVKKIQNQL